MWSRYCVPKQLLTATHSSPKAPLHLRIQFSAFLAELFFMWILLLRRLMLEVFPKPNRKKRRFCFLSFDTPTSYFFLDIFSHVCCLHSLWYFYLTFKIPSCKPVFWRKLSAMSLNFQFIFLSLTDIILLSRGQERTFDNNIH